MWKAMEVMEREETDLMLGTRRPWGVSIAIPMFMFERRMRRGGSLEGWLASKEGTSMRAFRRGHSARAIETAFIMKGR